MDFGSLIPYIIAALVVVVISVAGLHSDSFNTGFKYVLIAIGIIIAFGVLAAVITAGLGIITLPFVS